ncbi:MAG: DUF4055 domain-containing protein [Desulfovibrionaceae bacterium]|nr:DUF4055 domain-containing protein [Desulfovibrionaceae bacterium]
MASLVQTLETPSMEQFHQHDMMRLPHDLLGGSPAMVRAGERYIERGDGESDKAYRERLRRPALLNTFKRTLAYMRGQVFQKPVVFGDDASERFQLWAEDVDRAGNNVTAWAASVFEAGLCDGITYALADYSRVQVRQNNGVTEYFNETEQTWQTKTVASDKANGWAPYLVHIPAQNVIDCWVETRGGWPVVTHFRYFEYGMEPDGRTKWGQQQVVRIRVLWADSWQVWVKHGDADIFELESEGTSTLGVVPLSIFAPGEKCGHASAQPALYDLADLNRRYWSASCGQCELMEYVRRPVWFGRMLGKIRNADGTESDVTVGAGRMLASEDPYGDLKSVGVDASAVTASMAELETIKNEMAMYGLQLLQPKSGALTATEVDRDASENNSTLMGWAVGFQDFLENCLHYIAKWWGEEDGPSVKVNTQFSRAVQDSYLLEMYRSGALSLETYHELLKQTGTLPDDFDAEAEAEKLARGVMTNGTQGAAKSLASMLTGTGVV